MPPLPVHAQPLQACLIPNSLESFHQPWTFAMAQEEKDVIVDAKKGCCCTATVQFGVQLMPECVCYRFIWSSGCTLCKALGKPKGCVTALIARFDAKSGHVPNMGWAVHM